MKVLISAFQKDNDLLTYMNNHAELYDSITALGLTPQPVEGVWEGESETAFMITGINMSGVMHLHLEANKYNQKAILVVGDDNRAYLVDNMGLRTDIGDWREVSKEMAIQFDVYTKTRDGRYYVAATREQFGLATRRLLATQASVIAANEYAVRVNAAGV